MSATQSAMVFQADLLADEAQYPNFGNAVPEPMSLSILTLGVGGVMMRRRRA